MKGYINNVGSPSGRGLDAGVKKNTKINLKAKHKPMKVCANKKKSKVADEEGLTNRMEGLKNDVEISNERVRILEEKLKKKDAEIQRLKQRLQGYVNAPAIKSPNVYKVPLKEKDHKSWLEFKKLDEERAGQPGVRCIDGVRWPIDVDHPFVIVIGDFATEAFNEVIHMYAKKNVGSILSHSQVMSCEYTKDYYFHMTMEAIEEGLLGVYRVIVACDHIDGSTCTSLVNLKLIERKPTGKKNKDKVAAELTHQLKEEHKTIKAPYCGAYRFKSGLFPRGGFKGGYDYYTRSMDFGFYVPMK